MARIKIDRDEVKDLISELNYIRRYLSKCRISVYVSRSKLGYHYVIETLTDLSWREQMLLRFLFLDDVWRMFFDENRHERGFKYSKDLLFDDHEPLMVIEWNGTVKPAT